MLALIFAFCPMIVSALTGLIKMAPAFSKLSDAARTPAIRFLAAFLSLVYVLFSAWVTGSLNGDMLLVSVQTLALTFVGWVGSLGIFHAFFQKAQGITAPTI